MKIITSLFTILFNFSFVIGQCDEFEVDLDFTHPLCPDYADGSVTAVPIGGTAPYVIGITDSDGIIHNLDGGSETGNLLLEGWYYIDVEDAVGCTFSDSVLLVDPLEINVESYTLIEPSGVGVCDGAVILNEVTGDYENIFVSWSPDPASISGLGAFEFTDACAGVYEVMLISELGCSVSAEYEIGAGLGITENLDPSTKIYTINNGIKIIVDNLNSNLIFNAYTINGKLVVSQKLDSKENIIPINYKGLLVYSIFNSFNKVFYFDTIIR